MTTAAQDWYRNIYLRSDPWKLIRLEVAQKFNGKCQICQKESASNDVHHIWYDDIRCLRSAQFGYLCRGCHIRIHSLMKVKRCSSLAQQEKAVKEYRKTIKLLRAQPPKKRIQRAPFSCSCCWQESQILNGYDPIHNINGLFRFRVCPECQENIHAIISQKSPMLPSAAWRLVEAYANTLRPKLELDAKLEGDKMLSDVGSFLGDGI